MAGNASRLWAAATAALFVACGALIAVAAAGSLVPAADSINIFAPLWLAGTITFLLMAVLVGKRSKGGRRGAHTALSLLFTALLLGAVLLSPMAVPGSTIPIGRNYRLITFNMYKANTDPQRVARWILSEQADFVVLLEASPANRAVLANLQQRFPFRYDCSGKGHCSTYILSRFPAERVWPLARGDADNRQALSALTARFRLAGMPLTVTAVHLNHPWPLGDQRSQIAPLSNALAAVGRDGVLAGDFNSAPWTFSVRRLAAAADIRLISGAMGTWPTDAALAIFRLPLDQIYAAPCFTVHSVARGPALGSDHFPLIADLSGGDCHG